ncbi:MAG: phage tail protein [Alphaproteobacteria bacterium]|nr:phage tail protein [Alphaproteobacteria bacterium]MBV9373419.1 phage tail protein [Alphaproteobacteria bacterium]MBV9902547.1 phage tail protein [Alphaproteobacteria bacterium]
MAEPFLAEIRIVSFNFAPKGWAMCNGQLLPINQNQALFSLLGTTYGGDGRVNFALPDLRGRVQMHRGNGHTLGQKAGEQAHTLTMSEMPQHIHFAMASTNTGNNQSGANNVLGVVAGRLFTDPAALVTLQASTITNIGGSQAHQNMQPYLVLTYIIALQGIFPSQT